MAKPKAKRIRQLKFENFDEMMADAHTLHQRGYTSHGNWTLGQATSHVADWMRYPIDGFPKPPLPLAMIFWVMKYTVAPGMKRKILAEGFKPGTPTAPQTVASPDTMTDQQGIEKLQEVVQRVNSHRGPLHSSPLFGAMDPAMHAKVSLLHAEHHFGFLEPKA